jgi:phage terminase large subunit-like protein
MKSQMTNGPASTDYIAIAKQYSTEVLKGRIPACKWVKAACQRQIDDLRRWKRKSSPLVFDVSKAIKVCRFIENLTHIKGPLATQKIKLQPWQVFILTTTFGWVNQNGYRRFRRVYVEVPRGNGKSALSSGVGLYMLLADGEGGAECYSLATTRQQARIVFGDAQSMARANKGMQARFGATVTAHNIHVLKTASKFEALSAEGSTLDGLNTHIGIIDELHAHKTRAVYDVVETSIGKRTQSMLWVITTSGSDRAGICYEVRGFVTQILNDVLIRHDGLGYKIEGSGAVDESQFGIIYTIDDTDDWTSEDALIKANPNWGVSVMPEIVIPLQQKAVQMPSAANNFLTKHLDVWVNASVAWMDMRAWDRCADPTLSQDDFIGDDCHMGLDLATRSDICAKIKLFSREIDGKKHFYVFGDYFLPESAVTDGRNSQYSGWVRSGHLIETSGNVTDYETVANTIRRDAAQFNVIEIGFDPWNASHLANTLIEEGLELVEMRQGARTLSEPMKFLEELVLDGRLHHDGSPALTWMISNTMAKHDEADNIKPIKERDENKIDAVVALVMALGRAMANEAEPTPGVYIL